jgi:ethanolamine ammonia-lyase small subunit
MTGHGGGLLRPPPDLAALRRFTEARIFLGRAGAAMPTSAHLGFQLDHARARDAVHSTLDVEALSEGLQRRGLAFHQVRSAAQDRSEYVRRPDLGRRLDGAAPAVLERVARGHDVGIVIADGLSAAAVHGHVLPLLDALLPQLRRAGVGIGPVVLVENGRVAIGDPLGEILGFEVVVVLIGERPGLSAPDSLGCYITWQPRPALPDARRNCVSNIRRAGLSYEAAAGKIAYLITEARRRRISGVMLKEDAPCCSSRDQRRHGFDTTPNRAPDGARSCPKQACRYRTELFDPCSPA